MARTDEPIKKLCDILPPLKSLILKWGASCSMALLSQVSTSINVNIKMYIFDHLRMYIFAILPLDRYIFLSDTIFL